MRLEMHSNDNAREAKPSLFIFHGQWVGWLVVAVLCFISAFVLLSRMGVDWLPACVLSALPLAALTIFVAGFINGKAPSYALDLLLLGAWRFRCQLYLAGALNRPPELWVKGRKPMHPNIFITEEP